MSDQSNQVDLNQDGAWPEGFPVCNTPFHPEDFYDLSATALAGAVIRFPPNQQITVLAHVRAYADAAQEAIGVTSWGTYIGHQPSPSRATDAFVTKAQGDALCEWALRRENWVRFGLRYLMWWHHINYNDGRGWLWVEERGSDTANHMDHVHNGHQETAPEGDELTVAQIDDLNARIDSMEGKLDTILGRTEHAYNVLEEFKRERSDATGQRNWHLTGEAENTQTAVMFDMLDAINKKVDELKAKK